MHKKLTDYLFAIALYVMAICRNSLGFCTSLGKFSSIYLLLYVNTFMSKADNFFVRIHPQIFSPLAST